LAAIPEVQEVHHIAGEDCFVLKVRSRDAKSLGRLLRERISSIGTVQSTRTTVVLETMRESAQLPLEIHRETAVEVLHD
jgi:Lrp/AsnC family leucine-responsive transcriptional regulator